MQEAHSARSEWQTLQPPWPKEAALKWQCRRSVVPATNATLSPRLQELSSSEEPSHRLQESLCLTTASTAPTNSSYHALKYNARENMCQCSSKSINAENTPQRGPYPADLAVSAPNLRTPQSEEYHILGYNSQHVQPRQYTLRAPLHPPADFDTECCELCTPISR